MDCKNTLKSSTCMWYQHFWYIPVQLEISHDNPFWDVSGSDFKQTKLDYSFFEEGNYFSVECVDSFSKHDFLNYNWIILLNYILGHCDKNDIATVPFDWLSISGLILILYTCLLSLFSVASDTIPYLQACWKSWFLEKFIFLT